MALALCLAMVPKGPAQPAPPPPASLEILANPAGAPVSIVVYSDYACPYSSQFFFQLESLEKKYPGQVRVMMRQLPLAIHANSPLAHEAALAAAAQGKLAAMSELIFANQKQIDRDSLLKYADQAGLDAAAFRQALDTHAYRPIVEEDILEAEALGIDSTPTIFLNGRRLDGYQSFEVLDKNVTAALAKGGDAPSAAQADEGSIDAALFAKLTKSADEARGPASAPVTIVEFSDFQCPFCRQTLQPLEQLLTERPNQVRLVFRSFPLDFHEHSQLAHEAALAAGAQGKFWEMHDRIFEGQNQMERADLVRYAGELKLDLPAFERALDAHSYQGAIAADKALGAQLDVSGTPTMFINGKRITGRRSLVELEQLVDEQLRAATGTQQTVVATAAVRDTDFVVSGNDASPIHVSLFADVRSPLAARTAALLREMLAAYPGQLRIDYKTLALANHPDAELASRALLAAGAQAKFWPMYDALAGADQPLDRDALMKLALTLGLEPEAFRRTLDAAATSDALERDQAEEVRRGISGSPAIFVGDVRVDGLQPERVYREAIRSALAARGRQTAASGR